MSSSSTEVAPARDERARRIRLLWLLALLGVALASPALSRTSAQFVDTSSVASSFSVTTTGEGLVRLWSPVTWWRFDTAAPTDATVVGPPTLAAAFLTRDSTGALTLGAADSVAAAVGPLGTAWSAVLWVAPGAADGQLLRVTGLDVGGVEHVVSVQVAGGTVGLAVDGTPVAGTVPLSSGGSTLVALVNGPTELTLVADGTLTAPPLDLGVTEIRIGASPSTPGSAATVDEVALVPSALSAAQLTQVREVATWMPFAPRP